MQAVTDLYLEQFRANSELAAKVDEVTCDLAQARYAVTSATQLNSRKITAMKKILEDQSIALEGATENWNVYKDSIEEAIQYKQNFEEALETDDEELYAVTSDDKRVGNVLALVDSDFKSDISNIDGYYNMTCTATNGSNIITITEFTCDSVTGKFCMGIGISKNILAPVMLIPSEGGVVITLMAIPKHTGKIIIITYSTSTTLKRRVI